MAYISSELELVRCVVDIVGRNGPVYVDTGIAKHNYMLGDKMEKQGKEAEWLGILAADIKPIGEEGRKITKKDIQNFLDVAEARGKMKIFDNGRSYFFEGMNKKSDDSYEFLWGS